MFLYLSKVGQDPHNGVKLRLIRVNEKLKHASLME
jgi:hypothetical protein